MRASQISSPVAMSSSQMPMPPLSVASATRSLISLISSRCATFSLMSWNAPTSRTGTPLANSAEPTARTQMRRPSARTNGSSMSHGTPSVIAVRTACSIVSRASGG